MFKPINVAVFSRAPRLFLLMLAIWAMLPQIAVAQNANDGYAPNANDAVNVFVVQTDGKAMAKRWQSAGKALVGGAYTSIAGQMRNRIARLNSDGSLDAIFNPNAAPWCALSPCRLTASCC